MTIRLIAYGIAKEILETSSMDYNLHAGQSIADLKQDLIASHPRFAELRSLRFAVGEEYQSDDYKLGANEEVVIIPPVSGG